MAATATTGRSIFVRDARHFDSIALRLGNGGRAGAPGADPDKGREVELALGMHRVRAFADGDGRESEIDLSPVAAELELTVHLKIDGT